MRYNEATVKDFSPKVKSAIQTSIEEDKGIFIYGGTGTGKTYTLYALTKEVRDVDKYGDQKMVDVENFVALLVEFRDWMQKGMYHEKMVELTQQKYLFVDDIGSEKTSEFVVEFLYLVVNKRYENMKRTIFTTNLSLEEFRERYGDRILSRISEMCVLLELEGGDRRI